MRERKKNQRKVGGEEEEEGLCRRSLKPKGTPSTKLLQLLLGSSGKEEALKIRKNQHLFSGSLAFSFSNTLRKCSARGGEKKDETQPRRKFGGEYLFFQKKNGLLSSLSSSKKKRKI